VVVDFGLPSSTPRLWLIDLTSGGGLDSPLYVAHGKGSDPDGTGRPIRFGDVDGSLMSSLGAFRGGISYRGVHGLSVRLIGLDGSNRHAFDRHIVLHTSARVGPDYVSPAWLERYGKLGTSEGCFVVMAADFQRVSAALRGGGFLYAGVSNSS